MSHDLDHTHLGYSLSLRLANRCTQFEVFSFSWSKDISWGVKFQNGSRDPDHAHFRDA